MGDKVTQKLDTPPPVVLDVRATTSVDADGKPIQSTLSPDGSSIVSTTTSFTLRFSRFLLPSTVTRQAICVRSNLNPVTKLEDCPDALFLEPTYDPTRREVTYRQSATVDRLKPGTKYQLTVLPAVEGEPPIGFRAFDDALLEQPYAVQFSTFIEDPIGATLETLPTGDLFCEPKECNDACATSSAVTACQAACPADCAAPCMCDPMDTMCTNNCPMGDATCATNCKMCRSCADDCLAACTANCPLSVVSALSACAFPGCHLNDKDTTTGVLKAGAAMGLDLSRDGIAMTAINQVAHQTQQGEHADRPDTTPRRFGRAMPIIDGASADTPGGNPGNSYLMYKLAIGKSLTGDAVPDPDEVERLRASIVVGMPMPPPPGLVLRDVDVAAIMTWIAQGAPTPACQ